MTLDEVMMKRRSIRNYDAAAVVTEEQLRQIVSAAQEAPSWKNQETTRYHIAFTDEKFKAVQQCLLSTNPSRVEGSKALVVVTFVKNIAGFTLEGEPNNELGNGWGIYDAGLHNMLLMLKAAELGLDTLVMGLRDADALRRELNIPENETVVDVIAVGKRAADPARPPRKELDDIMKIY